MDRLLSVDKFQYSSSYHANDGHTRTAEPFEGPWSRCCRYYSSEVLGRGNISVGIGLLVMCGAPTRTLRGLCTQPASVLWWLRGIDT